MARRSSARLLALALLLFWLAPARAQSGHALSFHPFRGSEVNVPLQTPPGAFTLEAWVRSYADPETYGYFTIMEFGDDRPFFGVIGNALGVEGVVYAPSPLPTGTWQHVAYAFDGTTSRLFLNGTEVAARVAAPQRGGALGIGYGLGDTAWPGDIDEVVVWNRARTAAEIRADLDGLSPVEVADADLLAYFKFDEGAGQVVGNEKASGPSGTLGPSTAVEVNDPAWITVSSTPTGTEAPGTPGPLRLSAAWPQPARAGAQIEVEADGGAPVFVAVFDVLGRHALTLHDGPVSPAALRLSVPAGALSPGTYVVRAAGAGRVVSRTLVVGR